MQISSVYLAQASAGSGSFSLDAAWNSGTNPTDLLAVSNGIVLWLEGEPFF